MDHATLAAIVLDAVRARAPHGGGDLTLDTPLGPDGAGIDSIGCLEIVLELEERTGLVLRDETLTAEAMATPGSLLAHLIALHGNTHG